MTSDRERRLRQELHAVLARLSETREPLDLVEDVPVVEDFVDDFAQARIADARAAGASRRYAAGGPQALQRLAQARARHRRRDRAALHPRQERRLRC